MKPVTHSYSCDQERGQLVLDKWESIDFYIPHSGVLPEERNILIKQLWQPAKRVLCLIRKVHQLLSIWIVNNKVVTLHLEAIWICMEEHQPKNIQILSGSGPGRLCLLQIYAFRHISLKNKIGYYFSYFMYPKNKDIWM